MKKDIGDHIGKTMNQQLKDFGKSKKIPANVLKWIWNNKETLLALITLLFPKKVQTMDGSGDPDPGTTPPPPEDN